MRKLRWMLIGLLLAAPARADQHFPSIPLGDRTVRLQRIASGLADTIDGEAQVAPSAIVPFPDASGRLAVATLGGVVRVIGGNGALLATPLVTRAETGVTVPASGEWGMTAIVFDPDFAAAASPGRGTFYVINPTPGNGGGVTPDFGATGFQDHQDVVTAFTLADPSRSVWEPALGDTQRELFRVGQPGEVHNVVALAFGPDKMLYVSSGDGGAGADTAQDPTKIFGTILRINPHGTNGRTGEYGIPADNPFALGQKTTVYSPSELGGVQVQPLGEVFAFGFRSPYRMNFDSQTGDLYVGDVGQSDVEEVDLVEAGKNYGWNHKEGSLKSGQNLGSSRVEPDTPANNPWSPGHTQTLAQQFHLTDPIFEYDHHDGVVVIGGFVYRGSAVPDLDGLYVFGDLGEARPTARLFTGDLGTGAVEELRIDPSGVMFSNGEDLPTRLLSIGEDLDHELSLATVAVDPREGGGMAGEVIAVMPAPEAGGAALLATGGAVLLLAARRRSARREARG